MLSIVDRVDLPVGSIQGLETRAREDMGVIESLAENIEQVGLIQPIVVEENTHRLLAGGRRVLAFQHLKRETIPALIVSVEGTSSVEEIELFENRHRKDMHWSEEAILDAKIHDYYMRTRRHEKWTQTKSAKALGISKGEMSKRLQLSQYIEAVPELKQFDNATQAANSIKRLVDDKIVENEAKAIYEEQTSEPESKPTVSTGNPSLDASVLLAPYGQSIYDAYQIGDAIEGMKQLDAGTFHGAEVDPPYGINLITLRTDSAHDILNSRYQEVEEEDYPEFIHEVATEVFRLLSDDTFCLWWFAITRYAETRSVLEKVGFKVNRVPAIWFSGAAGQTNNPSFSLVNTYDTFFVLRKGNPTLVTMGQSNLFQAPKVPQSERWHATQRPEELMRKILRTFFPASSRLLVPFLGSGVTLLTAYQYRMWGTGWDKEESYRNHFLVAVNKLLERRSTSAAFRS